MVVTSTSRVYVGSRADRSLSRPPATGERSASTTRTRTVSSAPSMRLPLAPSSSPPRCGAAGNGVGLGRSPGSRPGDDPVIETMMMTPRRRRRNGLRCPARRLSPRPAHRREREREEMASACSSPRRGATDGEVGGGGDEKVGDGGGGAGPTDEDAWAEKTRTRGGGAEEDARRMGKNRKWLVGGLSK